MPPLDSVLGLHLPVLISSHLNPTCCPLDRSRRRCRVTTAAGGQVAATGHQSIDSNGAFPLIILVALVLLGIDVGIDQLLDTIGYQWFSLPGIDELCFVYSQPLYLNEEQN
jgi:hypothetical protein